MAFNYIHTTTYIHLHKAVAIPRAYLGIRLRRVDQSGRVHLHVLHVDVAGAEGLRHLDAVAGAVVAVGGRQVEDVGSHLFPDQAVRKDSREPRNLVSGSLNFFEVAHTCAPRVCHNQSSGICVWICVWKLKSSRLHKSSVHT